MYDHKATKVGELVHAVVIGTMTLREKREFRYIYMCLKIENYYLKFFVEICVSEKMCENT